MGVETAGLQSGIVLAVVIAAVLFADRFGAGEPLPLRVAQVALGLLLMMLVLSVTTAFQGPLEAQLRCRPMKRLSRRSLSLPSAAQ